jgi:hypothetical protein
MKITETWNGRRDFPVVGRYFELLSTVNAVDIEAFDEHGRLLERLDDVEEGFFMDRRGTTPFARIAITTGANEAVSFLVTDGFSGNRSVPADITDRAARLLGVVSGDVNVTDRAARLLGIVYGTLSGLAQVARGGVNVLEVAERGFAYGATFSSVTALAATTNEVILAPASNTAGVIVWRNRMSTVPTAGAGGHFSLLAKSSAPASMIDGDVLDCIGHFYATAAGQVSFASGFERPVFVAAGKGLYYRNGASAESLAMRSIQYTVL